MTVLRLYVVQRGEQPEATQTSIISTRARAREQRGTTGSGSPTSRFTVTNTYN
jgi:hypothetical protein